jgi:YD repeat-containing protein
VARLQTSSGTSVHPHHIDTFKYDPFGRRICKSSSAGTSVYAYDGDSLVEETNSSGTVVARYSQGLDIDESLAMLRGGATSFYQADGLGSVTSLTHSVGVVTQAYTYDSFGNTIATTRSLVNSFRYTGRRSAVTHLQPALDHCFLANLVERIGRLSTMTVGSRKSWTQRGRISSRSTIWGD